jgi:DNA-binding transcriptional ArsR family regulator
MSVTRAKSSRTPSPTPQLQLSADTRGFLKALASEGRQALLLLFAGGEELTVGQAAERAGIGQSTASEQLAMLRDAGVLSSRREGKLVRYRADRAGISERLAELQEYLASCCG